MADPRISRMAEVLVHYSLRLKKGDRMLIKAPYMALPLVQECYRVALEAGAHPEVHTLVEGLDELFFKYGSDHQFDALSPRELVVAREYQAYLVIWGDYNTKQLSGVDPQKIRRTRRARAEFERIFDERTLKGELNWCGTQFPTHADAQEASMGLFEYEDFVYNACLLDKADPVAEWRKIDATQAKITKYLDTKKQFAFRLRITDLTFMAEGRKWVNCSGQNNFPDGEVFTSPIENTVNGKIRFSFPGIYAGRAIEDIRLEFKDGKVVAASAAQGDDLLQAVLDTDEGARFVGEIAVGTNYGIQRFTRNMLFDEKIGGTVHLAVGNCYPETGGKNFSSIHWDMLCDMRDGGEITADGEVIYRDGRFIID